jgi:hypothetical protein
MIRALIIIGCLCAVLACAAKGTSERVLLDFESDAELDKVHWECHSLFALSDDHVTHGRHSLRLELYPSDYPGFFPIIHNHDWREWRTLCFDLFNPQENQHLQVTVRIDDRDDDPEYEDRYNGGFTLQPGMNRIAIPFGELRTSATHRQLDLSHIYQLGIFISHPAKTIVLYVDYLRLR